MLIIGLVLVFLASFVLATGFGITRENGVMTCPGRREFVSRTRAKKFFRSRGIRLAAGELAALMGDQLWVPQPLCGRKTFHAVPSEGRSWRTARRRANRRQERAKAQPVRGQVTRAAVLAKVARDRAAREARRARKQERQNCRALPKGEWARQQKAEAARREALAASAPVCQGLWRKTVVASRRPELLLLVARDSSVSRWHDAADSLESALAERLAARSPFEQGRARAQVAWAAADLREELLAA
ncbi:hypothetical protein HYW32_01715 [Candidatus Berkelbacteria bacterium]|nr:hypothetical protein [Candidatus Berkelbacteria bacterium]